jgi:hypothetical protein
MRRSDQVAEQTWVLRPQADRPPEVQSLAGTPVHSVSAPGPDGQVAVVLGDGTPVRVWPTELVAE